MTQKNRRAQGRVAEQLVQSHFIQQGYLPVAQSWTCRWGELDLIFEEVHPDQTRELVIIEVRSRIQSNELAEDWISQAKRRALLRSTAIFLRTYSGAIQQIRMDLVTVTGGGKIVHLKNWFCP